jgi:zinc transport system substrate-binding protein
MKSLIAGLLLSTSLLASQSALAAPDVVVSIKPIHSLVSAVMDGVAEPKLIVDGAASPHSFNLRPSNAKDLEAADIVFWLGNGFETFLEKPLSTLGSKAAVISLSHTPNIKLLPTREGGAFEAHSHDHGDEEPHDHAGEAEDHHDNHHEHKDGEAAHDHHEHSHDDAHAGHGENDLHIWLDPKNAIEITKHIAAVLTAHDADNGDTYQKNARNYIEALKKADSDIASSLKDVQSKPFIVFHDAYQYFEKAYDLNAVGSITVSPETPPGAERIETLRKKIKDAGVSCVFAEPQFQPKVISVITEGSDVKVGTLDPEATELKAGKNLYLELIGNIASSVKTCLYQ